MDKETQEDAKQTMEEISELLKDETLSAEELHILEIHQAALAGTLLRSWLPLGWGRRLIMIGIVALGVYGITEDNYQVFVWWLLLPFFSPRIVGEIGYFLGKLTRGALMYKKVFTIFHE